MKVVQRNPCEREETIFLSVNSHQLEKVQFPLYTLSLDGAQNCHTCSRNLVVMLKLKKQLKQVTRIQLDM